MSVIFEAGYETSTTVILILHSQIWHLSRHFSRPIPSTMRLAQPMRCWTRGRNQCIVRKCQLRPKRPRVCLSLKSLVIETNMIMVSTGARFGRRSSHEEYSHDVQFATSSSIWIVPIRPIWIPSSRDRVHSWPWSRRL